MKRAEPPKLATWLLNHLGDKYRREALIGDLIEEYRRGRSKAWYWHQVSCAVIAAGRAAVRARAPALLALVMWWCFLLGMTFLLKWPVIIFALDPTIYWLYKAKRKRTQKYGA